MDKIARIIKLCIIIFISSSALAKTNFKIAVTGVESEVYENIVKYLKYENTNSNKKITTEEIKHLYLSNTNNIKEAMQPFGYFHPQIEPSLQLLTTLFFVPLYLLKNNSLLFINLPTTYQNNFCSYRQVLSRKNTNLS